MIAREARNFIKTRGVHVGFDMGKRFCPLAARKRALAVRGAMRQSLLFETAVSDEALLEVSNVSGPCT